MLCRVSDRKLKCVCIAAALVMVFAGITAVDTAFAEEGMSDTAKGGIGGGLIGALAGSLGGYAGAGALIGGGIGLVGGAISDSSKEDKKENKEQKKQDAAVEKAYQQGLKEGKRVDYSEGTEHHEHISAFGDDMKN